MHVKSGEGKLPFSIVLPHRETLIPPFLFLILTNVCHNTSTLYYAKQDRDEKLLRVRPRLKINGCTEKLGEGRET